MPSIEIFSPQSTQRSQRKAGGNFLRNSSKIVICGEEAESMLLGAFTLEALGLSLDPLRRELKPLPMILAALPKEMRVE
jgi:hypothetical protein